MNALGRLEHIGFPVVLTAYRLDPLPILENVRAEHAKRDLGGVGWPIVGSDHSPPRSRRVSEAEPHKNIRCIRLVLSELRFGGSSFSVFALMHTSPNRSGSASQPAARRAAQF